MSNQHKKRVLDILERSVLRDKNPGSNPNFPVAIVNVEDLLGVPKEPDTPEDLKKAYEDFRDNPDEHEITVMWLPRLKIPQEERLKFVREVLPGLIHDNVIFYKPTPRQLRDAVEKQFPEIEGIRCTEFKLTIMSSGEELRIEARDVERTFHISEIGFVDRRTTTESGEFRPTMLWALLHVLARHNGEISPNSKYDSGFEVRVRKNLKKYFQMLRILLKHVLNIDEDPFEDYKKRGGVYRAKFQIKSFAKDKFTREDRTSKKRPSESDELQKLIEEQTKERNEGDIMKSYKSELKKSKKKRIDY